jgi:hypothetical protein
MQSGSVVCGAIAASAIGTDTAFDWSGLTIVDQSVRGLVEGDVLRSLS